MKKPKTFVIKSSDNRFLNLMCLDLEKIGYSFMEKNFSNNAHIEMLFTDEGINSLDNFKKVVCDTELPASGDNLFLLPEQYNEALDFAKQELGVAEEYFAEKKEWVMVEEIEILIEKFREKMDSYKATSEDISHAHNMVRFNGKYQATRDCMYELLQLIGKDPRFKANQI